MHSVRLYTYTYYAMGKLFWATEIISETHIIKAYNNFRVGVGFTDDLISLYIHSGS